MRFRCSRVDGVGQEVWVGGWCRPRAHRPRWWSFQRSGSCRVCVRASRQKRDRLAPFRRRAGAAEVEELGSGAACRSTGRHLAAAVASDASAIRSRTDEDVPLVGSAVASRSASSMRCAAVSSSDSADPLLTRDRRPGRSGRVVGRCGSDRFEPGRAALTAGTIASSARGRFPRRWRRGSIAPGTIGAGLLEQRGEVEDLVLTHRHAVESHRCHCRWCADQSRPNRRRW